MFLVPKLDDQIERWAVKHHALTADPGIQPQLRIHLIVGQLNADFRSGFLSATERLSESIDYFQDNKSLRILLRYWNSDEALR